MIKREMLKRGAVLKGSSFTYKILSINRSHIHYKLYTEAGEYISRATIGIQRFLNKMNINKVAKNV